MGIKRIIAANRFNLINGCYSADFFERGHTPVSLITRFYKQTDSTKDKRPIKIPNNLLNTMQSRGGFYVVKNVQTYERSPHINIRYNNAKMWDDAINRVCSQWGKDAWVLEVITNNRDQNTIVHWKKAATENVSKNGKLVLFSANGISWEDCPFKEQRRAAGDLWEDTCEYKEAKKTTYKAACEYGSHK